MYDEGFRQVLGLKVMKTMNKSNAMQLAITFWTVNDVLQVDFTSFAKNSPLGAGYSRLTGVLDNIIPWFFNYL